MDHGARSSNPIRDWKRSCGCEYQLLAVTWHDTYDALIGREKVDDITSRWHAVDVLARQVESADISFLVADIGGLIVGHSLANAQHAPTLFLARLYVLPAYQRRGIGESLLAAAIKRHAPMARVRVDVEADNAKGVSFYQRRGFVVLGETAQDDLNILQMEKVLA